MRTSSVVAASAAFAAGANAWGNVTYTTEVVTAYTTYCPSPTSPTHVVHGTKTYTITEVSHVQQQNLGDVRLVIDGIASEDKLYILTWTGG